jgi:hypothetical protein
MIYMNEWMHSQLQVPDHSIFMMQIDGIRRLVYINFVEISYVQDILHATNGTTVYKHISGEISTVRLELAGMGTRRVRIDNVPPEVNNGTICAVLSQYGEIHSLQNETWSKAYRYVAANGIKVAVMSFTKHIPSHITIAGYRVLIPYDGQPQTCYGCVIPPYVSRMPEEEGGKDPFTGPNRHNMGPHCRKRHPRTSQP